MPILKKEIKKSNENSIKNKDELIISSYNLN